MATEKQIIANQANARRSSGPRSDEGKAVSRCNALKHGLAATVVVPGEDAAELALRVAMMQGSLAADGDGAALIMAERMGYLSMRLKRCYQHEVALTARRVRDAIADFDEQQRAEADHILDYIAHEPAAGIRRLQATPEGVDLLIRSLQDLREQADGRWTDHHGLRFDQYVGRRPGHLPVCRLAGLSELIGRNNPEHLDPAELEPIPPAERRAWAIAQIGPLIDAEIDRLRALLPTLDHERFAQNRAEAPDRARDGSDPDLIRLRKYEAAADLAFDRTFRQLAAHRREGRRAPAEEITAQRAETNHECAPEMAEIREALLSDSPTALGDLAARFAPPPTTPEPPITPAELGSFPPANAAPARPIDASKFTIGKPPIAPPATPRKTPKPPRHTP